MIKKLSYVILKKIMGGYMERIIIRIIEEILNRTSEQMRNKIKEYILKLEETAKATKNPWDDLAVLIVKIALGIK